MKSVPKIGFFPLKSSKKQFWPAFNNAWGANAMLGEHGHARGACTMLGAPVSAF